MRHQERGMSVWPFVICLLLTLVFGFLWYSEKSNGEDLLQAKEKAEASHREKAMWLEQAVRYADELSDMVGYRSVPLLEGTEFTKTVTDVKALGKDLDPANADGSTGKFAAAAKIVAARGVFPAKAGGMDGKETGVTNLSADFKAKIADAASSFPGPIPPMPDDPDDATGNAKWSSDKAEWDRRYEAYSRKIEDLANSKEWPVYRATIGPVGLYDPDRVETVTFGLYVRPSKQTVEEYLKEPARVAARFVDTLKERVEAVAALVSQEKGERTKLNTQLTEVEGKLVAVEARLTETTGNLQKEAADARSALEQERLKAATAEQAVVTEKQDRKVEVANLESKLKAEEAARLAAKQKQDIVIARDDADGLVLAADNRMMIAWVNLGFADKVTPGMKFRVWYLGRGDIRQTKGEVMITKVLDAHYSQARIVSLVDGERPMGKGDFVSNPFFDKSKRLKIFVAGALRKYPRSVAADRLKAMGCDIQDAMDNTTDFIVIPDSVRVGPAAGEGGEDGEGGPPAQSEYDRLVAVARSFGATLITEKLLEAFLDY